MSTEPTGGALINIGELAKPVTVLIDRICDAVGAIFEPSQIKRIARADAEAALMKATGDLAVSDLQRRALRRVLHQEERRQKNIEQVTRLALPDVTNDAEPERIDADWLEHFFDRSMLVSDTEMQTLWGRLLAGEANKPGAFGRRTVELVSMLDKSDAQLFTSLCRFVWSAGQLVPLVCDVNADIYRSLGIRFDSLTHLESIGLIKFGGVMMFWNERLPKKVSVEYFGRPVSLEFEAESNNNLALGYALLTAAGRQLAPIAGAQPVEGFVDYVADYWRAKGCQVFPLPSNGELGAK